MKKYWHIAWMLLGLLLFTTGCKDDDDKIVIDDAWRTANVDAFNRRMHDPEIEYINSETGNGKILYKVLKKGEGTEPIYFNSKVECYYKGCLIADKDGNFVADLNNVMSEGKVFDKHWKEDGDDSAICEVNHVVDGWTTALQHMHVGDIWEIWIPYQLGYKETGQGREIPPCSTLVFQLEVASIVEQ